MTRARSATTGDPVARHGVGGSEPLPSIRFSTFYDPRATRPSLKFAPISRTLPSSGEVIRVGRYSERDNQPNVPVNAPSAAPVGFKSKVVSRRHCEFWYEDGKWYIRDVKSSSGTFLNHIRLSPPGTESKPYPVNDGDIVQLGIDFKGGEEMIFRCVKMRLELNRGWQNKLNTFNMATHKRLRNMTAGVATSPGGQSYSQDCSICLNTIAPCQCLFVAPCSHTWHYKCIRSLLSSPSFPIFICPNCRAAADLEAEVEDPEEWEQLDSDEGDRAPAAPEGVLLQLPPVPDNPRDTSPSAPRRSRESVRSARLQSQQQPPPPPEIPDITMLDSPPTPQPTPAHADESTSSLIFPPLSSLGLPLSHNTSAPLPIPFSAAQRILFSNSDGSSSSHRHSTRTPSPTGAPVTNGPEGPITPRNDAGPWVFDGSGVRLSADGQPAGDGGGGGSAGIEAAVQAAGRHGDDDIS
ncbi:SMAD/FHA domain-containing protein [Trichocladium antarcticum]|uniref:RING-type E3 ubiquitin transferase n=1 Tax=Trichocladium antarcticum TaxID=1450529 RepID=A0AAN6ZG64_9PEZI|nr:SMAD/FHA domain-containing protein [Trichocladium antarcticum]